MKILSRLIHGRRKVISTHCDGTLDAFHGFEIHGNPAQLVLKCDSGDRRFILQFDALETARLRSKLNAVGSLHVESSAVTEHSEIMREITGHSGLHV